MHLNEPAHRPSRKAPVVWAIGAAIPWLILVVAQAVWFGVDGRYGWLHVLLAAGTVLGIGVFVVVVPLCWDKHDRRRVLTFYHTSAST